MEGDVLIDVAELELAFQGVPGALDAAAEPGLDALDGAELHGAFAALPGVPRPRFRGKFDRMMWVRCCRTLKKKTEEHARERSDFMGLAEAWNRHMGLRAGDRVGGERRRASGNPNRRHYKRLRHRKGVVVDVGIVKGAPRRAHANQWDVPHMLREGFRGVGIRQPGHGSDFAGDVGAAHGGMPLTALLTTSAILGEALKTAIGSFMDDVGAGKYQGVYIAIHYDSTPMFTQFGMLSDAVQPMARYLHFDPERDRWVALPVERFRTASTRRSLPRQGILEVLAYRAEIHVATEHGSLSRRVLAPPCVIPNQRATGVMSGVNASSVHLSLPALTSLAEQRLRFFLVVERPDAHSACRRKMYATMSRLPRNVLFIPGVCAAHQLFRIKTHGATKSMAGDVHAIKTVVRVAGNANHMRDVLGQMVNDIEVLARDEVADADFAMWEAHRVRILDHMLFRRSMQTWFSICPLPTPKYGYQ